MADNASDEAARAIQLANMLPVEEVPAKLRCGMCNKLAVDAVKLLCCSTSICEPCSHDIPETCSVCTHSPTSPADCTPDKKLRTTVRAFIKTREKKGGKLTEPTPAPPVQEPTPAPVLETTETPANHAVDVAVPNIDKNANVKHGGVAQLTEPMEATAGASAADAQNDSEGETTMTAANGDQEQEEEEEDDDDGVVITVERPENEEEQLADDQQHAQDYDGDYTDQQYGGQGNGQQMNNFGQNQQGYGNMNNFNSMMGMQNGIGNFGMGMPNMMGMAGMGGMAGMNFDPSMMFPNGGFGGMGDMSAMMNMGMGGVNGMGGFGGMPGMNMNMGGGSGGFFGSGNSGGYNHHQQFGNQVNAPFHQQRGYYNRGGRGFGRGRGGFYPRGGRGGFNSFNQLSAGQNQNQTYINRQQNQGYQTGNNDQQQQDYRRGSPSYEPMATSGGTANDTAQQKGNGEGDDTNEAAPGATNVTEEQQQDENGNFAQTGVEGVDATDNVAGDTTIDDAASAQNNQSLSQQDSGYGAARGGFGANGGAYGNVTTIGEESEPPPAAPVNAPKGPKAMRQGLPNSGRYSRPQQPSVPPLQSTTSQADRSQDHGGSRTRSRSPSRHESRKARERTPIAERESDEAYAERKERERERRKRKERDAQDKHDGETGGEEKVKSRSDSLDDYEKRKHRDRYDDRPSSRRDRSREKRKHRDRSRSPEKARSNHDESSDRSRRKSKHDRSNDDGDDDGRAKDRHSSRKHSRRDEAYTYDSKDRSKHSQSSKDDGKGRDRDRERRQAEPEPAEDLGISIKGAAQNKKNSSSFGNSMGLPSAPRSSRDDRRNSVRGADSTPATPVAAEDPYAAEREKQIEARLARHKDNSLGKRTSRTEDEIAAGGGEHRGSGSRSKRQRQDTRRHSARFE